MMKKLIAASAVALMAASAHADSGNMTGFYTGLSLGYGIGYNDLKNDGDSEDISTDGAVGTLFLGYQKDFGRFVAGLEAHGSITGADGTSRDSNGDTFSLDRNHAYGIAAKLGTKLNNWLAYVKLGYERAEYELKATSAAGSVKRDRNFNSFLLGLGMETMVTSNLMFGGEYTHSFASDKTLRLGNEDFKVDPRFGEFKLRLAYKF